MRSEFCAERTLQLSPIRRCGLHSRPCVKVGLCARWSERQFGVCLGQNHQTRRSAKQLAFLVNRIRSREGCHDTPAVVYIGTGHLVPESRGAVTWVSRNRVWVCRFKCQDRTHTGAFRPARMPHWLARAILRMSCHLPFPSRGKYRK